MILLQGDGCQKFIIECNSLLCCRANQSIGPFVGSGPLIFQQVLSPCTSWEQICRLCGYLVWPEYNPVSALEQSGNSNSVLTGLSKSPESVHFPRRVPSLLWLLCQGHLSPSAGLALETWRYNAEVHCMFSWNNPKRLLPLVQYAISFHCRW